MGEDEFKAGTTEFCEKIEWFCCTTEPLWYRNQIDTLIIIKHTYPIDVVKARTAASILLWCTMTDNTHRKHEKSYEQVMNKFRMSVSNTVRYSLVENLPPTRGFRGQVI